MACWIKLGLGNRDPKRCASASHWHFSSRRHSAAFAGGGFDIVIPGRPGVPIIISGVDASYAVVEGDWGLGQGTQVQPTVYGGRYYRSRSERRPLLSERRPHARLRAAGNRAAGEPPIAAAGRELSSILVGAVGAAAGAIQRTRQSARDHLRAAGLPAATDQTRRRTTGEGRTISTLRKSSQRKHRQERVMRHLIKGLIAAVAVMAADRRV